ncbi:MAG TPA: ATP-binding protein [Vicinamibacterales bacterium]|nr:ATP-binding protein [Vicinamibacterales bacterium]
MPAEPTTQLRTTNKIAIAAGALAIVVGGGHAVAWITGAIAQPSAGTVVMTTNTAVGFLLCGLALSLLAWPAPGPARRRIAGACAALAFLLGAATVSEHVFGWNLGIDELLASGPAGALANPPRMRPPTAVSFVFLGLSLLLLARGRRPHERAMVHEAPAVIVLLLGLLETIALLYGAIELQSMVRFTGLTWGTAVLPVVVAAGVLCARPGEGMMACLTAPDEGGVIARALLGPVVFLPILFGWAHLRTERLRWFDESTGTSLLTLASVVTFLALVLFASRRVSLSYVALRKSEREAQRQKELHAEVMSTTDVNIAYLDADFNFVVVNAAYAESCRMKPEEMVGLNHFALYPHPENEVIFRRVRDTGQSVFYKDKPFEYPDQPERGLMYWDWSLVPLKDATGKVIGVVLSLRETTKYKQAQDALRQGKERLQRLVEASTAVLGQTTPEGLLAVISEAARDLTGARHVAVGHGFVNGEFLIGAASRRGEGPRCPPASTFKVERGGVHLDLMQDADAIRMDDAELRAHPRWWGLPGDHVPLRGLLGVRLLAGDGSPNGMILATDKEEGEFTADDEAALRQLAAIGSLGLQETAVRNELEEADRRKNQFLAVLSHELRNPLAAIRAALYIVNHATSSPAHAGQARAVIDRQVAQLTRLVDDLLDVTRITRGKIQLQRGPLDFVALVRRTAEDHRSMFVNRGIDLEIALTNEALWVDGDEHRLTQAVGNLLHNAAKFTDRGGRTVIRAGRDEAWDRGIITVRDTGIGITPAALRRLFEPFIQEEQSIDRARGGLGLGLSLVKSLVEMHGGTVQARSDGLGKGAEFTIRLPLQASPAVPRPEPARARHQLRRVLIIEDNVDAAITLQRALALAGHQVEVAYTGQEGLAKATQFDPHVILCDIGLPGMDGYEVARACRISDALRDVYLVALTGYALPDDVAKAREAGFDLHAAKPLSTEKLEDLLGAIDRTEVSPDSEHVSPPGGSVH